MVCMQAVLLGVSGAMHALKLQSAPTHRDTVLPCRACRSLQLLPASALHRASTEARATMLVLRVT